VYFCFLLNSHLLLFKYALYLHAYIYTYYYVYYIPRSIVFKIRIEHIRHRTLYFMVYFVGFSIFTNINNILFNYLHIDVVIIEKKN